MNYEMKLFQDNSLIFNFIRFYQLSNMTIQTGINLYLVLHKLVASF